MSLTHRWWGPFPIGTGAVVPRAPSLDSWGDTPLDLLTNRAAAERYRAVHARGTAEDCRQEMEAAIKRAVDADARAEIFEASAAALRPHALERAA